MILFRQGRNREALDLLQEVEQSCRRLQLLDTLAATLGQQANILSSMNQGIDAARKNRQAEKFYREVNNIFGLAQCLFNQAVLCMNMCSLREEGEYLECWLDWRAIGLTKGEEALKAPDYPQFPTH